jgi:triosephosphate isomerase
MSAMAGRLNIIANWKMYVQTPDEAKRFAQQLRRRVKTYPSVDISIAPPAPLIASVATALKGSKFKVGAQTLSPYTEGAHTGDISAPMLKAAGASFVLVGHSERREVETEAVVRAQVKTALDAGLKVVLCVGEKERDESGAHFEFLSKQLRSAFADAGKDTGKITVAYEPVWAIGKSAHDAMPPAQVRETVIFIRKILADIFGRMPSRRIPILYGGSVEKENARDLVLQGEVSGFLVGHASAKFDSFFELLKESSRK